jgi:hypothetical protein
MALSRCKDICRPNVVAVLLVITKPITLFMKDTASAMVKYVSNWAIRQHGFNTRPHARQGRGREFGRSMG